MTSQCTFMFTCSRMIYKSIVLIFYKMTCHICAKRDFSIQLNSATSYHIGDEGKADLRLLRQLWQRTDPLENSTAKLKTGPLTRSVSSSISMLTTCRMLGRSELFSSAHVESRRTSWPRVYLIRPIVLKRRPWNA